MSTYKWEDVLFCEKDRTTRRVPGTIIGDYSVSPVLMDDCPDDQFSASVWRVSELHYGIAIVQYTDFKVAIAFARYLNKHYGSLKELAKRYVEQSPLTDEDTRILDEIDTKRRHETIDCGMYTAYIPFNPDDY